MGQLYKYLSFAYIIFFLLSNNISAATYYQQKGDSIVLDNGIVKRTIVFQNETLKSVSLRLKGDSMDFLGSGNEEVNHFSFEHLQLRIFQLEEKLIFVYNTWNPFRTFINDNLIEQVADAAAECGMVELIIDDGWQVNYKGKTSENPWGNN